MELTKDSILTKIFQHCPKAIAMGKKNTLEGCPYLLNTTTKIYLNSDQSSLSPSPPLWSKTLPCLVWTSTIVF